MPMKNFNYMKLLMVMVCICAPLASFADYCPPPPPPSGAPIDGGLSLLLVAGVGYGAKKIADSRKKQKENNSAK